MLNRLAVLAAPLAERMARPVASLAELLGAHVALAEGLAADDAGSGAARLWRGEAGEAAAGFVADLALAADDLPPLSGGGYPGLLQNLMQRCRRAADWGGHPRLAIWGPLEARLQHADRLILGGLNEGTWPPDGGR